MKMWLCLLFFESEGERGLLRRLYMEPTFLLQLINILSDSLQINRIGAST